MTSFERIGGIAPVTASTPAGAAGDAAATARGTMAAAGDRVLAWTAQSFGTGAAAGAAWSARTGGDGGFAPDHAVLARGGDVYQLRALTAEIAGAHGATPAEEGALGRAIEDFTRAVALRFNALAGGPEGAMLDDVAAAVDSAAAADAGSGIGGVTARIESAAAMVEALNR